MNIVEEIKEKWRGSLRAPHPEFAPGDTLKVHVKVVREPVREFRFLKAFVLQEKRIHKFKLHRPCFQRG